MSFLTSLLLGHPQKDRTGRWKVKWVYNAGGGDSRSFNNRPAAVAFAKEQRKRGLIHVRVVKA